LIKRFRRLSHVPSRGERGCKNKFLRSTQVRLVPHGGVPKVL